MADSYQATVDEFAVQQLRVLLESREAKSSERVWLALEAKGIEHTTVLIDNTGHGRRPSWYSGTTPQIRWADGKTQGESLDLVRELDVRFPATPPLFEASGVDAAISAFRRCFPRNARPSSRAAYLFSYDGPLPRSTFEAALDATEGREALELKADDFELGAFNDKLRGMAHDVAFGTGFAMLRTGLGELGEEQARRLI